MQKLKFRLMSAIGLFLFACIALTITFFSLSYSWFYSGYSNTSDKVKFTAQYAMVPEVSAWTYTTSSEGTEGWEELKSDNTTKFISLPTISSSITNGKTVFSLKSLQFGSIDNLMELKKDNILYLRIKMDIDKQGGEAIIGTDYYNYDNHQYITIYDSEGNDITNVDGIGYDNLKEFSIDNPLISYSYCVNTSAYSPGDTDFPTDFIDINSSVTISNDEDYYIYVKISPNLLSITTLQSSIKTINNYMPCHIIVDIDMSFESKLQEVK